MNLSSRVVVLCGCLGACVQLARPAEFRFATQTITVPDGFEVALVAGPPLVERPITGAFDEQGRLYVPDSSGTNDKVDKQLAEKPHRILRLEDTDGDGRFDQRTVFADKMMFPEGCLWYRGSVYVSAPPSIWKLTDTDGDGVADQREEWLNLKTLTGCANDLHGPLLGPDGWIYWCKGAFAQQTYEAVGKPTFVTRAAHIFRARLDGTGIEAVLTGGMDNPVSIAFTPGGERILTGTFFVHPGGGHRDGLIHAIYGGVYGKDHDVLQGHKRTGDLMPIMTHHGPSASAFVLSYQSGAFGAEYRDNLFACLFNLRKVTRHILKPDGATFQTHDEDFLVSDNPDFHPTAVIEDSDGSLLVVDTGGWYKLCCPTSQLWKPDVLGAIYRVRRTGVPKVDDPRGLRLPWNNVAPGDLVQRLGDQRLGVRERAVDQLARLQSGAIPQLDQCVAQGTNALARRQAVWALTRIEGDEARAAARKAVTDGDPSVRQAALHSISVWRDGKAIPELLQVLGGTDAPLRRVAAEALGRLGDGKAVPALLEAASLQCDRVLEHSLIYALIEIADAPSVRQFLAKAGSASSARRAAMIALDQMTGGGIEPKEIADWLTSSDPILRETSSWLVGMHPDWAGALAGFMRQRLGSPVLPEAEAAALERHLSAFARDGEIQQLLADVLREPSTAEASRFIVLRAMAKANLKKAPAAWAEVLADIVHAKEPVLVPAALAAARAQVFSPAESTRLRGALTDLGRDATQSAGVRLDALAALPGGIKELDPETFRFVRSCLDAAQPVLVRGTAASVLAKGRLTADQLLALTESVKVIGPLEVGKLLDAFAKSSDEQLGLKLVAALKECSGLSGLRPDNIKPILTNFPAVVQQAGEQLLALVNVDGEAQRAHIDDLLTRLKGGDIRRGQTVFNNQKAACSTCHAIGYLGGDVGPDLTRIGQIRSERDLLEAIAYPSASFVRSYEPMLVSTKSGDDYSGVVRGDAPDQIVLATGPGAQVRIPRSDIAEMRPGTVSVMPGGLEEQLSREELADLIAFLKATRW